MGNWYNVVWIIFRFFLELVDYDLVLDASVHIIHQRPLPSNPQGASHPLLTMEQIGYLVQRRLFLPINYHQISNENPPSTIYCYPRPKLESFYQIQSYFVTLQCKRLPRVAGIGSRTSISFSLAVATPAAAAAAATEK